MTATSREAEASETRIRYQAHLRLRTYDMDFFLPISHIGISSQPNTGRKRISQRRFQESLGPHGANRYHDERNLLQMNLLRGRERRGGPSPS